MRYTSSEKAVIIMYSYTNANIIVTVDKLQVSYQPTNNKPYVTVEFDWPYINVYYDGVLTNEHFITDPLIHNQLFNELPNEQDSKVWENINDYILVSGYDDVSSYIGNLVFN